tara:strand:- start:1120 stop:1620 length:501 start_codon:yes stop_codon:yes gene_type:complete
MRFFSESLIIALFKCSVLSLLVGCYSYNASPSKTDWRPVSVDDFRDTVEGKPDRSFWFYVGSNEEFHYFFRAKGGKFFGGTIYYEVPKSDLIKIPIEDQYPFRGRPSPAFRYGTSDDGYYIHRLSEGLNEAEPSPLQDDRGQPESVGTAGMGHGHKNTEKTSGLDN